MADQVTEGGSIPELGLTGIHNWQKKSAAGNLVRHCRYDNAAKGTSTYVTVTHMLDSEGNAVADKAPIPAYRQGPLGSDELAAVTEAEFDDAGFVEAFSLEYQAPSKFASLFASKAPKAKVASRTGL